MRSRIASLAFFLLLADVVAGRLLAQGGLGGKIQLNPLSSAPARSLRAVEDSLPPDPRAAEVGLRMRENLAALRGTRSQSLGQAASSPQFLPEQRNAFLALSRRLGGPPEIRLRRFAGTPIEIKGRSLEPAAFRGAPWEDGGEKTARAFLRANRDLLRVDDPETELTLTQNELDDLGRRHFRFSQSFRGLLVWPAELIVHLDPEGNVDGMSGAYVATPRETGTTPVIDSQSAVALAREAVPQGSAGFAGVPELIIYAPGDRPSRLAWKVEVSVSFDSRWLVVIDAMNGTALIAFNQILEANVHGSGTDLLGVTRSLNVWEEGGIFYLANTSKPMFDPTSDPPSPKTARGAIIVVDARNQPPSSEPESFPTTFPIVSASATSGFLRDGVSAAFGLSETYEYYLERHSRNSIDGQGGTVLAAVRLGLGLENAFWSNQNMMVFGDAQPYAASLDVVAHELTHGVTQHTANLVHQGQSGALNEAFSDIFGEAVEARNRGSADWLIGTSLPSPLRDIRDPSSLECCFGRRYPSKFSEYIATSEDDGGVHLNSTIISHAFYLLSEGLSGAIGIGDAERTFYRALSLRLVRNSRFIDARLACISSAEEIFGKGSTQAQKTAEVFDRVEIFDGTAAPEPEPFPEVSGPDSTIFVYRDTGTGSLVLGRQEEALGDPAQGIGISASGLAGSRPSVTGDGSLAAFLDVNDDVCMILTNGSNRELCLGRPGQVSSIAVSPKGDMIGFVLRGVSGNPENKISVVDLPGGGVRTFSLAAPIQDGTSAGTVAYADAMDFMANGRFLVYDAFNELTLDDGSQIGSWSIYALDLATEIVLMLLPPIPGVDIEFPSLSQTSDNFITFNARDQVTGESAIFAANLYSGDLRTVAFSLTTTLMAPSYTGDDSAIVLSASNDFVPTGFSLLSQPVAADQITPEGTGSLWLSDAAFGVIYRRGAFLAPVHDLAVTKLKVPKNVSLTAKKPSQTKPVSVEIQNRSPHEEIISDLNKLRSLVQLSITSLGNCPAPVPVLLPPRKPFPIRLKPKQKLSVVFNVTFDCANDAAKTTKKSPGHEDFSFSASVDRSALDGEVDTHEEDDTCPRDVSPPFEIDPSIPKIKDKGCGTKKGDKTFGGTMLTDVTQK